MLRSAHPHIFLLSSVLVLVFAVTWAIPIDNGVKGYPKVTCGLHSIRVDVDTERPFQGRVFVKGESYNKDCIKSFAGTPPAGGPAAVHAVAVDGYGRASPAAVPVGYGETVGIELGFGQCNMRRQRTLSPRGVEYTFTFVISFHPLFITKVDKAYRVRCFYMEAEKTVAQQLEVSMLTTHQINEQFPMPQCRYHIKRGGPEGPYIRFARVGEPVHHVWECDAPAAWLYGILVKNCYVDDGQGNRVELLDEKGCANDRHILPDLTYDQSLISAWVESHVFKYAYKPHLYFTCTIVLCFKQDGGCNGITPPNCLGSPVAPAYPAPPPPLPVPGPYPAAPAVVPYAPPPAPIPAPVYAPRPIGGPYNRDAPLKDDKVNGTAAVDAALNALDSHDNRLDNLDAEFTTPGGNRSVSSTRRIVQKREASKHENATVTRGVNRKTMREFIETDLSAQPVIVLPFEDETHDDESDFDADVHDAVRKTITSATLAKRPYAAFIPNVRGGAMPSGVCISSSGFGILVALFLSLFILSTVLTVLVVRRHALFVKTYNN